MDYTWSLESEAPYPQPAMKPWRIDDAEPWAKWYVPETSHIAWSWSATLGMVYDHVWSCHDVLCLVAAANLTPPIWQLAVVDISNLLSALRQRGSFRRARCSVGHGPLHCADEAVAVAWVKVMLWWLLPVSRVGVQQLLFEQWLASMFHRVLYLDMALGQDHLRLFT